MKKFEYQILKIQSKGIWGYKIDYDLLTTQLNELGSKGWEVATGSATAYSQTTAHGVIILKREIIH